MKVLVPVKRVIDFSTHIRIKKDQSGVETDNVKMGMNPFDEIAVEEAVRLKEKGLISEIVIVSIGNPSSQETIRTALAMGADRGLFIDSASEVEPLATALILKKIIEKESPELVILGKQAIDTDNNQVGQMLAGLLNWSQGTFISKLELIDKKVLVTREIDGGLEKLELTLPVILTTDLRLNEPRYLSLPNIVKAKSKPIATSSLAEWLPDYQARIKTISMNAPAKRGHGVKLESAKELVTALRSGGVI